MEKIIVNQKVLLRAFQKSARDLKSSVIRIDVMRDDYKGIAQDERINGCKISESSYADRIADILRKHEIDAKALGLIKAYMDIGRAVRLTEGDIEWERVLITLPNGKYKIYDSCRGGEYSAEELKNEGYVSVRLEDGTPEYVLKSKSRSYGSFGYLWSELAKHYKIK